MNYVRQLVSPSRPNPGRKEKIKLKVLFQYNFQKCAERKGLKLFTDNEIGLNLKTIYSYAYLYT